MAIMFSGKKKLVIFLIPKIIWHTYETQYELLPENIRSFRESWIKDYPDFEHNYMDAEQRKEFVLKEYGQEWYDIFINLPHNIMRADLWRHMVIYRYGGIYFDLDTYPLYNINKWLKDNYSFIAIADESEEQMLFFYHVMAGSANNKITESVLQTMFNQFNSDSYKQDNPNSKYFVFKYSAELVFMKGIRKILDPNNRIPECIKHNTFNELETAKKYGFYCYANDYDINNGKAFKTIDGAKNWTLGYNSWWKEVEKK